MTDIAYECHDDVLDRPQARHVKSAAFVYLLLACTFLFYFFAPFLHRYTANLDGPGNPSKVWRVLMYSASMHVALTGIFYLDPAMFALIKQDRLRFLVGAPLVFAGTFWIWVFGSPLVLAYATLVYIGWTYWHFQKQHWGVYSFIRIHEKSKPRPLDRAIALYLGFLPAAFVWLAWIILTNATMFWQPLVPAARVVQQLAAPTLFLSIAVVMYAVVRECRTARQLGQPIAVLSLVMLAFMAVNNAPFVFLGTEQLPTYMVNTGHGLQYVVFMTVFAYDRNRVFRLRENSGAETAAAAISRRIDARWVGPLIGLVYVGLMFGGAAWAFHGRATHYVTDFFSGYQVSHAHFVRIAEGFALAITLTHYVVDASAWKLTKPESRAVMLQKYRFLLARP